MPDAKDLAALVKEAREHDKAMTPGPWRVGTDPSHFGAPEVTDGKTFAHYVGNDAAGIAWLRNHVGALCDAIEELQRSSAAWEDEAAGAHHDLAAANAEIERLRNAASFSERADQHKSQVIADQAKEIDRLRKLLWPNGDVG